MTDNEREFASIGAPHGLLHITIRDSRGALKNPRLGPHREHFHEATSDLVFSDATEPYRNARGIACFLCLVGMAASGTPDAPASASLGPDCYPPPIYDRLVAVNALRTGDREPPFRRLNRNVSPAPAAGAP